MDVARANTALPACSTQSNMVEACSLPLRAMYIVPFLGTQWVYVAIKQVVALCSQTPFQSSVAGPPERVRAVCAGKPGSLLKGAVKVLLLPLSQKLYLCFFLANRAHPRK